MANLYKMVNIKNEIIIIQLQTTAWELETRYTPRMRGKIQKRTRKGKGKVLQILLVPIYMTNGR